MSIPNRLFFDGDGLITLFNHYKFTVEENTPVEQEVALDPELLGKVFENLLAAYNPETRETARKQTGSYYTPRVVVDYMVEEALVVTLVEKAPPDDGDAAYWQERLRYLLDYEDAFDDANELFEEAEAEGVVRAIAEIKVLDPAVGSGAFPMGILHKLTLALQRIDPDNQRWQSLQKERARQRADEAFETKISKSATPSCWRSARPLSGIRAISGASCISFRTASSGWIFSQWLARLPSCGFSFRWRLNKKPTRLPTTSASNRCRIWRRGLWRRIRCWGSRKRINWTCFAIQIEALKAKLAENRERHFHATTRREKLACRSEDKRLRKALAGN